MSYLAPLLLASLRLAAFALALGLTLVSFQAYRQMQTDRLEAAFIGFAFISMATALSTLGTQLKAISLLFQVAEIVPFVVGFSMLYVSLYR